MKAVREIIWYLNGRGLMTAEDIKYLRQRGVLDHGEEVELADAQPGAKYRNRPPAADLVDPAAEFGVRPAERRKARRSPPDPHALAAVLSERVLVQWPRFAASLSLLGQFAHGLGSAGETACADSFAALAIIRTAAPPRLAKRVIDVLDGCRPSLGELWPALTADPADGVLTSADKGPAVVAFRAIACGAGPTELGSYATVLRHEGLARLMALVRAQRAILLALGRVLVAEPAHFERALRPGRFDADCYWALTLVLSGLVLEGRAYGINLHVPARPYAALGKPQVRKAWEAASMIDRRLTTRTLAAFDDPTRASDTTLPIRCPSQWDKGYFAASNRNERPP